MATLTGHQIHQLVTERGQGFEEIASEYGMTASAVRSKYYRWRKRVGLVEEEKDNGELGDSVGYEECGNHARVTARARDRITSIEDLLIACKISLDEWMIVRAKVNKWEMGAKRERKDLTIKEGVISGTIKAGGATITPLIQVQVTLERLVPRPTQWPAIAPALVNLGDLPASPAREGVYGIALIIPDMQVGFARDFQSASLEPFHDRRAIDVCVQVAAQLQPDLIILLGDNHDATEWTSKFKRTPEYYFTTQPAILELAWIIGQLRKAAPGAEIHYLEGNHERRMSDYVAANLVGCYGLKAASAMRRPPVVSVPFLLDLDALGVVYHEGYPDAEQWVNDGLRCTHGSVVRTGGGNSAAARVKEVDSSECMGHIHRTEMAARTIFNRHGRHEVRVFSPGTVARVDGIVPATKQHVDWQQGFAIVEYDPVGGDYQEELVSIRNGRCLARGRIYEGENHRERIRDETGWREI